MILSFILTVFQLIGSFIVPGDSFDYIKESFTTTNKACYSERYYKISETRKTNIKRSNIVLGVLEGERKHMGLKKCSNTMAETSKISDDPDLIEDSEYIKDMKKTGKFGWIWIVLIVLALMSIISIVLI